MTLSDVTRRYMAGGYGPIGSAGAAESAIQDLAGILKQLYGISDSEALSRATNMFAQEVHRQATGSNYEPPAPSATITDGSTSPTAPTVVDNPSSVGYTPPASTIPPDTSTATVTKAATTFADVTNKYKSGGYGRVGSGEAVVQAIQAYAYVLQSQDVALTDQLALVQGQAMFNQNFPTSTPPPDPAPKPAPTPVDPPTDVRSGLSREGVALDVFGKTEAGLGTIYRDYLNRTTPAGASDWWRDYLARQQPEQESVFRQMRGLGDISRPEGAQGPGYAWQQFLNNKGQMMPASLASLQGLTGRANELLLGSGTGLNDAAAGYRKQLAGNQPEQYNLALQSVMKGVPWELRGSFGELAQSAFDRWRMENLVPKDDLSQGFLPEFMRRGSRFSNFPMR